MLYSVGGLTPPYTDLINRKERAMKTIRNKEAGNFKRSPDKEARKMVATGKWEFVPKSAWKQEVRDK